MATRGGSIPRPRGFAAMDQGVQRAIASKGGRIAHQRGAAHEWNSQEAAEAGRKGGRARFEARRSDEERRRNEAMTTVPSDGAESREQAPNDVE